MCVCACVCVGVCVCVCVCVQRRCRGPKYCIQKDTVAHSIAVASHSYHIHNTAQSCAVQCSWGVSLRRAPSAALLRRVRSDSAASGHS